LPKDGSMKRKRAQSERQTQCNSKNLLSAWTSAKQATADCSLSSI
jgi:hypothetical protein